jgi:hypothetical protein
MPAQFWANKSRIFAKTSGTNAYNPNPLYWLGKWTLPGGIYPSQAGNSQNPSVLVQYGFTTGNLNYQNPANGVNISCTNNFDLYGNTNLDAPINLMAMQALGNNANLSPEESIAWWEKYNYYVSLREDPTLITTQDEQQFKDNTDAEAIGKLEDVKQRMLDSLYLDSLGLEQTKLLNDAVITNNELEARLKEANDYYIRLLMAKGGEFIFSESDVAEMQSLAALCPSTYGPGVYAIRSVLARIDTVPQLYTSPCEITRNPLDEGGTNQRRSAIQPKQREGEPDFTEMYDSDLNSITNGQELEVSVYPNPAQNTLYIENKTGIQFTYQLLDARGSVVLSGNNLTNTKPFSISTEKLSNGLYVLKVTDSKSSTTSIKVSIQK